MPENNRGRSTSIRIPPYDPVRIRKWLRLVEAELRAHGITDDTKRFHHAFGELTPQLTELLPIYEGDQKFEELKSHLLYFEFDHPDYDPNELDDLDFVDETPRSDDTSPPSSENTNIPLPIATPSDPTTTDATYTPIISPSSVSPPPNSASLSSETQGNYTAPIAIIQTSSTPNTSPPSPPSTPDITTPTIEFFPSISTPSVSTTANAPSTPTLTPSSISQTPDIQGNPTELPAVFRSSSTPPTPPSTSNTTTSNTSDDSPPTTTRSGQSSRPLHEFPASSIILEDRWSSEKCPGGYCGALCTHEMYTNLHNSIRCTEDKQPEKHTKRDKRESNLSQSHSPVRNANPSLSESSDTFLTELQLLRYSQRSHEENPDRMVRSYKRTKFVTSPRHSRTASHPGRSSLGPRFGPSSRSDFTHDFSQIQKETPLVYCLLHRRLTCRPWTLRSVDAELNRIPYHPVSNLAPPPSWTLDFSQIQKEIPLVSCLLHRRLTCRPWTLRSVDAELDRIPYHPGSNLAPPSSRTLIALLQSLVAVFLFYSSGICSRHCQTLTQYFL